MRLVVVHAVLLVAALLLAWRTWAGDDVQPAAPGSVLLWNGAPEDVTSVVYEGEATRVLLEQRRDEAGSYLWATVSPAGAGGAGEPVQFLVGEPATRLLESVAAPRAIRDLGAVDAEREREYGLEEAPARLVVDLGSGGRELLIGATVFGTRDQYVKDPASGRVYVMPGGTIGSLENAESMLPERRPHAFTFDRVSEATLRTERGERTMVRTGTSALGTRSWAPPERPDQPDQTFANFMDRLQQLWIADFAASVDREGLRRLLRVDYSDAAGRPLGHVELLRDDRGDDPEYYVWTEHSRVPARISRSIAEALDQDVAQLF